MVDADDPKILLSDDSSSSNEDDTDVLEINFGKEKKLQPYALRRLHVGHLLQLILQDAQTRLVFRTQAVLQSEVSNFTPKVEDLDYPAKLQGKFTTRTSLDGTN
jgi:hypothetical protein